MLKSGAALLAALALSPVAAAPAADAFEQGMETMWEVLWHQSGTATRMVRWEKDIQVRMSGVQVAAHRPHALQALRAVAAEAGVQVVDVTDRPDTPANVTIEVVPDTALSADQPCETRLDYRSETVIDAVAMKVRASDARRCAYHESMHVMGVRGHPEGNTVLSYFDAPAGGLTALDKAMLRAFYSPRARAGMTPFELLPLLADQLVALSPDKAKAALARDRFLARTVAQMQAFAAGTGDIPAIIKRCGKATDIGVRYGRMEMSYFLAVAYEQGASVAPDGAQAAAWLQRAAGLGSRSAVARLAGSTATLAAGRG